jgi:membrane protease YdiL (CAAX protease family)
MTLVPSAALPDPDVVLLPPPSPTLQQRAMAAIEVLLCSDYPTQILLGGTFTALGYSAQTADGGLSIGFVATLSLLDTVALIGLMWFFLAARGDRVRDVFLGSRPIASEVRAGLPMILLAFLVAAIVLLSIRALVPSLHNVETNPLQELMRNPRDAALFALVAVVAGGIREELQRAFLLNRFERWLGGPRIGVIAASAAFGLGHLLQGADAAIATGVLGAFWAIVYLRRRSVVAPMVSHSGFNLLQLVQLLAVGR